MRAFKYPIDQLRPQSTADVLQPTSSYGLGETGVRPALDTSASIQSPKSGVDQFSPIGGPTKRVFDIAVAMLVLLLAAPLLILIAVSIKISEGGPVLFRQQRVGHKGQLFECLKFRTMAINAGELLERHLAADPTARREWRETRKLSRDPRVTWLGRALRKSSLDELPQLINVLRGEMSCVGPRPVVPEELSSYGSSASSYLVTRPGLTGMWQVSGRNKLTYRQRVALDTYYVAHWSIWMDLVILVQTLPALMSFSETS
jgi:exopolysaccharide production protein ExoY